MASLKEQITKVAMEYCITEGVSKQSAYRDIITDIIHSCKEANMDFDEILNNAREVEAMEEEESL